MYRDGGSEEAGIILVVETQSWNDFVQVNLVTSIWGQPPQALTTSGQQGVTYVEKRPEDNNGWEKPSGQSEGQN